MNQNHNVRKRTVNRLVRSKNLATSSLLYKYKLYVFGNCNMQRLQLHLAIKYPA